MKTSENRGVRRGMMVISDDQTLSFNVNIPDDLAAANERFSSK